MRTQLEQVEHHIAAAFAHFDERDSTLTDEVMGQVKAHGELIATETASLVEAMQEYVQTGAEAMAILARHMEVQAEAFTVQDITISEHVGDMVTSQIGPSPSSSSCSPRRSACMGATRTRFVRPWSVWSRPGSWDWPS